VGAIISISRLREGSWLFAVSSVIFIPAMVIVAFFLKESMHSPAQHVSITSVFSAARDRRFLAFTGLSLLVFMVMGQMISTLSVYTVGHVEFSPAQFGTLLTVNGLVVVALQYPVGRAISRLPKAPILISSALLYAVGYLLMGWIGAYWLALVAMVLITLGEIVFSPTSQAVVGELAPEKWRGRFMGFYGLSETLGTSFGPMLGGYLLDAFPTGPVVIWGIICGIALAAGLGFYAWGRPVKNVVL
jgi:MFS family permease